MLQLQMACICHIPACNHRRPFLQDKCVLCTSGCFAPPASTKALDGTMCQQFADKLQSHALSCLAWCCLAL